MLATEIIQEVQRDVASFRDPGTTVTLTESGRLTWTKARVERTAQLIRQPSGGLPDVGIEGSVFNYQGFLASEALADLRDLAQSILSQLLLPDHFIPAPARDETAKTEVADAAELVLQATVDVANLPFAATRVLFIHGDAGTGKTSALLHATRLQAERYLRGETNTLLLYLDAQGRGLLQLEDVIARALQDLRARFTYHSVAALTRRHCVVPVVDGFDELIGPSSAREAFANLAHFLAQLDCAGAVVTSSRSAFIDYKTLHERAAEIAAARGLSYEIHPVKILSWPTQRVFAYCQGRDPGAKVLEPRIRELLASRAAALVAKPFSLSRICDILFEGGSVDAEGDVVRQIIEAALAREADKLRDRRGRPLLDWHQHRILCEALADEMWLQAGPELDCDTVRLIAEICGVQFGLPSENLKTLVDRSITHGLLTAAGGASQEKRAFEHELFRFEFQAGRLAEVALEEGDSGMGDYLARAEIPIEVVSRLRAYRQWSPDDVRAVLARASRIASGSKSNPHAAANGGALVAALVRDRQDLGEGLKFVGLYMRGHDFGESRLRRGELRQCVLESVDLSGAEFIDCVVSDTKLITCTLSSRSKWDRTHLAVEDFAGLLWQKTTERDETYDPKRIALLLQNCGAVLTVPEAEPQKVSDEVQDRIDLVERLLKHARTHYYLSRQDVWVRKQLLGHSRWPQVEELLRKHSLLTDVSITKSGRPELFMRLTAPPDAILRARSAAGLDLRSSTSDFWRDLTAE